MEDPTENNIEVEKNEILLSENSNVIDDDGIETEDQDQSEDENIEGENVASEPSSDNLGVGLDESLNINTSIGSPEKYRDRTFYTCVNLSLSESQNKKIEILQELEGELLRKIESITNQYNSRRKELNEKIDFCEKLKTIEEATRESDLIKLNGELTELEDSLSKYEYELDEALKKLSVAKRDFSSNGIKDVSGDIKVLISEYEGIIKERKKINDNRSALENKSRDQRFKTLSHLVDTTKLRYDLVISKIKKLNLDGVNPLIYHILISIGTIGAISSGWFFSIYAIDKDLNSESTLFFIIKGLFSFGDTLKLNSSWYQPIIVLLGFVLLLTVISSIVFLAEQMQNNSGKLNKSKFQLGTDGTNKSFNARLEADSFQNFWWQILPGIFITGVLAMILFMARSGITNIGELNKLDISLSAQIIGTALCLSMSGLMYLYILKIVENRKQDSGKLILMNIELVVLLSLIIIVFILNLAITSTLKSSLVLQLFLLTSLASSYCFAYGYRFRGLIRTENYLLKKLNLYQERLRTELKPYDNVLSAEEENQFRKSYRSLQAKLFDIVEGKSKQYQLKEKKDDDKNKKEEIDQSSNSLLTPNSIRKIPFQVVKWINKNGRSAISNLIYRVKENWEDEEDINVDINDDVIILPVEKMEVERTLVRVTNTKNKIKSLKRSITLKEQKIEIKRLNQQKSSFLKFKTKLLAQENYKKETLHTQAYEASTAVHDGFDLAMWHNNNGLSKIGIE